MSDNVNSGDGPGDDGNQNYQGFSASAQPPANKQQWVSVSGQVLIDPALQPSLSQIQEGGASESALELQLNLNGQPSGANPVWVNVAFNSSVQLEEGNAIDQVEINSDALGDLTIQVGSGGLRANVNSGGGGGGPGDDGNQNYQGFNASAQPPANNQQWVSVSGQVLIDPALQPSLSQIQESGASESALELQLNLNGQPGGANPAWVNVAFNSYVQMEEGNAISQVEINSDTLGDLTIQVGSGLRSQAARPDSIQGKAAQAGPAAPAGGNPRYNVIKTLSHRYQPHKGLDLMMVVVAGWVQVDPGIQPVLRLSRDPPPDPRSRDTLLLDLELFQQPGHWPHGPGWVQVEYGDVLALWGTTALPPVRVKILSAELGDATFALTPV